MLAVGWQGRRLSVKCLDSLRLGILLSFGPGAALGIGRFAYALVLPAMQVDLELSYTGAGFLGSANTAGYLLGALVSHRVLNHVGYRQGFYLSLLLQTATILLLAFAPSFGSLIVLRFAQGVLGAFVFVGGAALLLASGGKGLATGIYFGGVGLGIVFSPIVMPLAGDWRTAWQLSAALSLLMALIALLGYSDTKEPVRASLSDNHSLRPIAPLMVAYGLYGAGYIGYMTFVTTGLLVSVELFWLVLGLGAITGGVMWGRWVDRVSGVNGIVHVLLVLTLSSLFPLVVHLPWLSGAAFGMSFLGVITAITRAFSASLSPGAWPRAMGLSTAAFATGQAVGPSVSGLAGEVVGGSAGALGVSSLLLALALAVAWSHQRWGVRFR